MSVPAVLCPHPPLLFRELTGATDVGAGLRAACLTAVGGMLAESPDVVLVVGGAGTPRSWEPSLTPDVRRFGAMASRTAPGAGLPLPLSLGVGRRLLDESGWTGSTTLVSVVWDAGPGDLDTLVGQLDDLAERSASLGLLLLGDGSARRGERAPGSLDPRAFELDNRVARALAEGDGRALRDLDVDLARDLMVGGASVLRLLGSLGLTRGVQSARLTHRDDPFGVSYFVARWDLA